MKPRETRFPCSWSQRRFWLLHQIVPESDRYNTGRVIELSGVLDVGGLEWAIGEVIGRHESLRTTFVEIDGEPWQVVGEAGGWELPREDLTGLGGAELEEEIRRRAEEMAGRGFDLERGPLFRAELLRLSDSEHVLLLSMHHIVSDGWSMDVLFRELSVLYEAYGGGSATSPLPELPVQYADYAMWQREWLEGGELARQLTYWKGKLSGAPELLELPTDRARPAVQSHRGGRERFDIPAEVMEGLRALGREEGATLFMVLLAAFKVLMARYSGQEDVVVGTVIANRNHPDLQGLIGSFLNTLALRTDLSGEPSFREVLRRVRETTLDAYEHQDLPFEKLVEELPGVRDLTRTPIFQVMCAMQSGTEQDGPQRGLGDVRMRVAAMQPADAKMLLFVYFRELGTRVTVTFEHQACLGEALIASFLAELSEIFTQMSETPDRSALRQQHSHAPNLREGGLSGAVIEDEPIGMTGWSAFDSAARMWGYRPAVEAGARVLTYAELRGMAVDFADGVLTAGVSRDDLVAILLPRDHRLIVSLLGCLAAQRCYVPIGPEVPDSRVRAILSDASVRLVVAEARTIEELGKEQPQEWRAFESLIAGSDGTFDPTMGEPSLNALAYVVYTSGSTGKPKGVGIEHRGLAALLEWTRATFSPADFEGMLATTSVSFDLSVFEVFGTLSMGGCVLLKEDALDIGAEPSLGRVTFLNTVPSAAAALLDSVGLPDTLRVICLCGEVFSGTLAIALRRSGFEGRLFNLYGPSEDTTYSTAFEVPMEQVDKGCEAPPIGRPIRGTSAYVLDEELKPTAIGIAGEVYLSGHGVAQGYVNAPAATAASFLPDPFAEHGPGSRMYRTGDLATIGPDGHLHFLGRRDRQVKLRGFRVELDEVERVLERHPAIREVRVCLVGERGESPQLCAFVRLGDRESIDVSLDLASTDLADWAVRLIPRYMVPTHVFALPSLPTTERGKTDYKALVEWADRELGLTSGPQVAHRSELAPLEAYLAKVWGDLLGLQAVKRTDDFFLLGGTSLSAMRLVAQVRSDMGIRLTLDVVFRFSTLEALAATIREGGRHSRDDEALPDRHLRVRRPEPSRLSHAQERLWFLDRMYPGDAFYTVSKGVRLSGVLDVGGLEWAIGEVIGRHESLRTTFVEIDGEPWQVVGEAGGWELPREDLTGLGGAELEEEIRRRAEEMAGWGFDLERGPLFRAELLRLSDSEHVLLLSMHHIVSDGWSMDVLFRELSVLYEAYGGGSATSPLPELPVQYADYAMWQREWLEGGELARQLTYWKGKLSGAPELLELPTDRARPAVQSHRGGRERFDIPAEVVEGLRALGREEGATLFMVLLAAFKVLMARYSGQEDVVVGTVIANRSREEFEGLIGFFLNTLALRTDLSGEPSFREVLRRVRETTLDAYEHQDLPFEKLVEELNVERSLAHHPVFQVMFTLRSPEKRALKLGELEATSVSTDSHTAKFDLVAMLVEKEDGSVVGSCGYSTDLFDSATIERMMGHYGRLLESVVEDVECPIYEMAMLGEDERRQLLEEWNETGVSYPEASVHELFEGQVERTPEGIAVECEGERYTYRELNERANQVAHQLRRLGVGPEVRVGLCVERGMELVVGMLGALKAGGAYVPLDPDYPPKRLAFMAEDSEVEVLLTQRRLVDRVPSLAVEVVYLDREEPIFDTADTMNLQVPVDPENLAYIIYTSGSTGTPKGTLVHHSAIPGFIHENFDLHTDSLELIPEVWAHYSAISWDALTLEVWTPLLRGGRVEIVPPTAEGGISLPNFADALRRGAVTHLWLTASLFNEIVDTAVEILGSLRLILVGGESLSPLHVHALMTEYPDMIVINGYGPSECTVFATCHLIGGEIRNDTLPLSIPIGQPVGDRKCFVLDQWMQPVPVGVRGELYVGGAAVARGYARRAGLTAARFVPDLFGEAGGRLYRTGDLVRWMPKGVLEFHGRVDAQVKVRGFRVELGEVESMISSHPDIKACAVVSDVGGSRGVEPIAFVIPRASGLIDERDLREWLTDRMPSFMIPHGIIIVDSLPTTTTGKVDRRELGWQVEKRLRHANWERSSARYELIESLLVELVREVTGATSLSLSDDFFSVGGTSFTATRLAWRIRDALGVGLPVQAVFEKRTIGAIAALVRKLRTTRVSPRPRLVPRLREAGPTPASYAQRQMFILERLVRGRATYVINNGVRLSGVLDVGGLEWAIGEVIGRHESLRTTFVEIDGEPWQVVGEAGGWELPREDLTGLGGAELEEEIRRRAEEMAGRGFDLERGPLFRAELLRLSDSEHVLLLSMHHIVSDGWSMDVLFRELSVLYEAYGGGSATSPLPELPVQYADYAMWQREWLEGGELARQLTYWKGKLSGAPELLELPTDRARPAVQSHRGTFLHFDYPTLAQPLERLGREEGATLFMVLLAAFKVLIARYSGQEDVVVGSVSSGRIEPTLDPIIGCFVNTLALRTDLSGEPSFREVLRRIRETTLEAYEHQDLPFAKLVEELNVERSPAYNPVFQVMFSMPIASDSVRRLGGAIDLRRTTTSYKSSKFDLQVFVVRNPQGLRGWLEYSTDLFDSATIERMMGHYGRLLESVVEDVECPIYEMAMLGEDERRQLLEEWNETGVSYPEASVHELFEGQVERTPEGIAVECEGERYTYRELNERANQVAHQLRRLGVGPEVRVGLCVERGMELVVGMLGALKAGGAYVPLDPDYPPKRRAFMAEDSEVEVLLTQRRLVDRVPSLAVEVVYLDREEPIFDTADTMNLQVPVDPENLAYIIYTSGSTGTPKGVLIPHGAVAGLFRATDHHFRFDESDTWPLFHSYAFDFSVWEIWGALLHGSRLVIVPFWVSRSATAFGEFIRDEGITIVNQTPSAFMELRNVDGQCDEAFLSGVKYVVLGGEALDVTSTQDWLRERADSDLILCNMYGITEATVHSTLKRLDVKESATRHSAIGRPLPGWTLYVLDGGMQLVAVGVAGELYIGGAGLARGYWGRAGLTAERFVPNPFGERGERLYVTGDRVRWRSDGQLEFLGRFDDQVKVRGFRIEPGEVESVLMGHERVRDAVVVVQEDEEGDRKLVGYVVLEGRADGTGEVRRYLRDRLPEFMVPNYLVALDELPLNPSGKIDRASLPEPTNQRDGLAEYVEPRTRVEKVIAEIWSEVLGVEEIGIHDNFFELGGHSLLAMRVSDLIQARLGASPSLEAFYSSGTVRALAGGLGDTLPVSVGEPPLVVALTTEKIGMASVICPHAVGAGVLSYEALSKLLAKDFNVFGIRATSCESPRFARHGTVEVMARDYVEEIRTRGLADPLNLVGWSFGGVIAYEMALQLEAVKKVVGSLTLIDCRGYVGEQINHVAPIMAIMSDLTGSGFLDKLEGMSPDEQLAVARSELARMSAPESRAERLAVYERNRSAWLQYRPTRFRGDVLFLRASNEPLPTGEEPAPYWQRLIDGSLVIRQVPCIHNEIMKEPFVGAVAEELRTVLVMARQCGSA